MIDVLLGVFFTMLGMGIGYKLKRLQPKRESSISDLDEIQGLISQISAPMRPKKRRPKVNSEESAYLKELDEKRAKSSRNRH